ncbi:MAG: hypothetical protein AUJ49_09120 [Desulfovibrionaceae bacterium CG1_02_65_16]|nr:MAG: hypothetical protein AUJ49_09120 [Desulfovibrionaceae bacterium CG1_02_65_16]
MSANPLDLPILISQLPNVQQLLGPQHIPAEAQQALFGQIVADTQRKEEHNVQEVEKQDGLDAMGRDSGGNNKEAQQQAQRQLARRTPSAHEEALSSTQSSNASPWAGNIINVKI